MRQRRMLKMNKYDFGGWATKYNIACSDGRTILNDAFKHCDDQQVPLVWNHTYTGPESVIGKATLKHCAEGVYAYCEFNENETAVTAKNLVIHGDITALSIYANKLQQNGGRVLQGDIKEVSLVLAGANPGASIQEVLVHGESDGSEATIYNDETELEIRHSDDDKKEAPEDDKKEEQELNHSDEKKEGPETVADVYNTLTDKQKAAVAMIIDQLSEEDDQNETNNEGDETMKHNVFEQGKGQEGNELKHSEFIAATLRDAKKYGSLKESFLAHAGTYGIDTIETLFPEATAITNEPIFIDRDQSWVSGFLNATKKSPFSKLKAIYADITADEARALGYTKGNLKKEEVFGLLKRTTSPTTVYKKQKLDRDDIIDITDFDVVAWMKKEMRGKLDEELARAILIGDGRSALSPDKIKETCIRPIYDDSDLYTIKVAIAAGDKAKEFIKAVIKSRSEYEGTGVPNLYTTDTMLADMLLLEDTTGRFIYENVDVLAKTLRVKEIITVPVMKNLVRATTDSKTHNVLGIVVNPSDYTVGADKGGAVSMFDDFDIDYNQQKYLMETRCSGSLLKPKTAMTIEEVVA